VKGNKIYIGAFELKNSAAFAAGFGIKGLQGVDARKAQDAIARYINTHGGMGGRTAVPLYHELDATSTDTYAAIAQAACEDFTRDREVFAVVAGTADSAQCLTDGKVLTINDADAAGDEAFVKRLGPYYYGPGQLNYDRKAAAWGEGLASLGFLSVPVELAVLAGLSVVFLVGANFLLAYMERLAIREGRLTDRTR